MHELLALDKSTWSHITMCQQIIFILTRWEVFTPVLTGGFSLKSKWQQVSSNLLFYPFSTVLWSGFSSNVLFPRHFYSSFGTVASASTTIGITVTFMYYNFYSFLARCKYLSLFLFFFLSLFFFFKLWNSKIHSITIFKSSLSGWHRGIRLYLNFLV